MGPPLLQRAAALLAPASLRLRMEGPRYLTFVSRAEPSDGDWLLTLEPIAGVGVATRAWLDLRVDGQNLWMAGRIEEAGGGRARFRVRGEAEVRPRRPGRLDGSAAVATFVPAQTGLGRCFCPVLDLGRHAMRVESSLPFPRGTVLRDVVLTHRNELLRRADGTVLSLGELVHPDGRSSWECAVRLRRRGEPAPADDPADTFEIRDYPRVCAIYWALCDLEYEVTVKHGPARYTARLSAKRGARDRLPDMLCRLDEEEGTVTGAVQVECALFGSGYRFLARAQRRDARLLQLTPAPLVRESHRRDEERFLFSPSTPATAALLHPLEPRPWELRLSDISATGFGVQLSRGETLWPELPLYDVELRLPGLTLHPPRAWVRTVDDGRAGVEMAGLDERQAEQLRVELIKLSGHPAALHDGEDLDALRAFHRRVGLLEADMERNLEATLDDMRRNWRLAHQHPSGLMRTIVGRWRGEVGATANVVRAYDAGWMLQHTAVASAGAPATPGLMYTMLLGLITPRVDCEYLASYATDEFKSFHSNWITFAQAFSTPHFRGATPFWLYAHGAVPAGDTRARRLGADEELLVQNAAERLLDPVCARALGLRAGELSLSRAAADFRALGIDRGREAWVSSDGSALLVREWASPGLSLSSLLSTGMLLPLHDGDGAAELCRLLPSLPVPGEPPVRFLFVPKSVDASPVEKAGFRRVGGCVLYACHRVGLREFLRFFAARYGFLQARMSVRKPVAA